MSKQLYRCGRCGHTCNAEAMYSVYPSEAVPYCPHCDESDYMFPVFEDLPYESHPNLDEMVVHTFTKEELLEALGK